MRRANATGGDDVAETTQRKPYWRQTKTLMVSSLALPCILLIGLPDWVTRLDSVSVIGLPLGFLLAVHVVVIVVIAAVARFAMTQEQIDRWHGTHDNS